MFLLIKFWYINENTLSIFVLLTALVYLFFELIRYVNVTNKKVSKFLDSVKYADFVSGYTADNDKGATYRELNRSLHEVMNVFRKTRLEKEEHLLFASMILEHIHTGIISFDYEGNIGVYNRMAKELLQKENMRKISEIKYDYPKLYKHLLRMDYGSDVLVRMDANVQLSLKMTSIKMKGKEWKVVALQNIYSELEQNELEAWQNLTRVLRHEIMNSITPISTLTSTLKDILKSDSFKNEKVYSIPEESFDDLTLGLKTIEKRSEGLIRFVEAYRNYTNIPHLNMESMEINELVNEMMELWKQDLKNADIQITRQANPASLFVKVDKQLIHQVLLNMMKNAKEALVGIEDKEITIAIMAKPKTVELSIRDNGQGIDDEDLKRIFVPFYTTKAGGSGIGLSLSQQIMHLHQGNIRVDSATGKGALFNLSFPRITEVVHDPFFATADVGKKD